MPRVLVVDDSRPIRRIIGSMMRQLGFEVLEAEHGLEALKALRATSVDLILCDWNMPVMDGLSFVRIARKESGSRHTPIIMITTETEIERMTLALEAGVNEYIMKPFDQAMLQEKLEWLGIGATS